MTTTATSPPPAATPARPPAARAMDNAAVAARLREAADLLDAQGDNPFRVAAYRRAASEIDALPGPVRAVFERGGRDGLDALPGIGPGIAGAIAEMLLTGGWGQLQRLRGDADPVRLLRAVPGIGAMLGQRVHDELHVDTLEGLEAVAADGRLAALRGVGPRRAGAVAAVLSAMLDRGRARQRAAAGPAPGGGPDVGLLLDVDRAYREKAAAGTLPTIAPRRFNPGGEAWLPVWHTVRGPWHFTALYSNTARAHELGREHDWVVLYFRDGDGVERQHTVVTETRGVMAGRRVVRGRERECAAWQAAGTPEKTTTS